MAKKRYEITLTLNIVLEVDPEVVEAALEPGWAYAMAAEEDVIQMLAWNCAVKDRELSHLDGWADRQDSDIEVLECEVDEIEILEGG